MAAALATVMSFLLVVLVSVAHGWNKDCPPPGSGGGGHHGKPPGSGSGGGGGHHGKPPEHHHHHKPPPSPRCPSCHPPYTPPTPRPPPTPPYVPSPPYVPPYIPPPYVPPYIPPPTPPYVPPYIPPPTPPYVPPYVPPPTPPSPPPYVPSPTPPYVPPPSPPATKTCPIDALKLNACVDVLGGLIHLVIGQKARAKCCPLVQGIADLDAALCLCTTIRARLLNINIYLPVALELLITCGKHPPPGFKCPPLYGA
uniref:Hydrophobic seed protein domain-containing protein n=1 Tax=Oryza glumipatula TaxID=40148 RepID=A0A0E0A5M3_9ORYZ